MKIDHYVYDKLTFIKVVFALFYAIILYLPGDKMALPMLLALLVCLFDELKIMVIGIVGLPSLIYVLFTGFYHYDKRWNYKMTIILTSILLLITGLPVYYAEMYGSTSFYIILLITWIMAGFIIYGSHLGIRYLKAEEMEQAK